MLGDSPAVSSRGALGGAESEPTPAASDSPAASGAADGGGGAGVGVVSGGPRGGMTIEEFLARVEAGEPLSGALMARRRQMRGGGRRTGPERDFLDSEQWRARPAVQVKRRSPTGPRGAAMLGKETETAKAARFLSRDLNDHLMMGAHSPGPMAYSPYQHEKPRGVSFGRALRQTLGPTGKDGPGPAYDAATAIGRTALSQWPSAPQARLARGERFSSAFPVVAGKDSPGPDAYRPQSRSTAPAVTMKGREFGRLFVSREHDRHSAGFDSPGPQYTWDPNVHLRRAPCASLGPTDPSDMELMPVTIGRDTERFCPGCDSPGPAAYKPDSSKVLRRSPQHSMALPLSGGPRHLSQSPLKDSPGPIYNPGGGCGGRTAVGQGAPAHSFADPSFGSDPYKAARTGRFPKGRYEGRDMANRDTATLGGGAAVGATAPGPGQYDTSRRLPSRGTGGVFWGKQNPRIYELLHPDRAQFISTGMATSLGIDSPGPGYNPALGTGTTGAVGTGAPRFSFGLSDREYREGIREDDGEERTRPPPTHTCPADARYYAQGLDVHHYGRASPGPGAYDITRRPRLPGPRMHSPVGLARESSPARPSPSRESPGGVGGGPPPVPKRLPGVKIDPRSPARTDLDKSLSIAGRDAPGPNAYNPSLVQVEAHKPTPRVGVLR